MEKINIFNYEIFYLDYLEGNLNEKDTSLLFAFLEQHPELKMEDEDLPVLELNEQIITFSKKDTIKQPLFSDTITENNIEYFLIAQAEGLLSAKEQQKVNHFIEKNPIYEKERELLNAVYFTPDEGIIYSHKENLKKKKVFVLWPYISIAASLLLAFLIWNSSQSTKIETPLHPIAEKQIETQNKEDVEDQRDEKNLQNVVAEKESRPKLVHSQKKEPLKTPENKTKVVPAQKTDDLPVENVPEMINNTPQQPLISVNQKELKPVTPHTSYNLKNTQNSSSMSGNLVNPIEPITAFLEKKTNRIIEFKKQERTENQPKKLFIKVGRFEFYRKKH